VEWSTFILAGEVCNWQLDIDWLGLWNFFRVRERKTFVAAAAQVLLWMKFLLIMMCKMTFQSIAARQLAVLID
jgi:hypothetical protein